MTTHPDGQPDEPALRRPVGWWLKEADSRLDAAFDAALADRGVDRRGWQVLATIERSATSPADLATVLSPFDEGSVVETVVDDFHRRGWVEESDGLLRLTAEGTSQQRALATVVDGLRQRVVDALPQDDYVQLVRLLARLVDAFGGAGTVTVR